MNELLTDSPHHRSLHRAYLLKFVMTSCGPQGGCNSKRESSEQFTSGRRSSPEAASEAVLVILRERSALSLLDKSFVLQVRCLLAEILHYLRKGLLGKPNQNHTAGQRLNDLRAFARLQRTKSKALFAIIDPASLLHSAYVSQRLEVG